MSGLLRPLPVENETPRDIPRRMREAAARHPGKVALIDGDLRLAASEFVNRMDRAAAMLVELGLREGDVIATLGGATADHLTLYLGAAALGVAVAPLPVSAHVDAIMRMLENSGAKLVFGDETAPDLPANAPPLRDIAGVVAEALALAPLEPRALSHDLLFDIIYSSGTTGAPKGIEHDIRFRDRQVDRFARFGVEQESIVLFSTPLYSNTTLSALITAVALGSTTILMRKFDALEFLRLAESERVTHAMLVPVQIRRIVEHPAFGDFDLSSFQAKLSTSAPLPPEVVRQVLARWPGKMINIYGMTEGGVSATMDYAAFPDKLHAVGRVGAGSEIRVIDEAGNSLAPGEAGEIVGRLTTVMRGYRKAPEATRAMIWTSPEGEEFMRSGDMGRFDEDGFLTLLDRRKDMIISGGFNIFAADLEAVLAGHEDVAEAAVIAAPSERWGETPVACVVFRSGAKADAAALLRWANDRLGKTQRLSAIAPMAELPRSSIGKVLKRELRDEWARLREREGAARV